MWSIVTLWSIVTPWNTVSLWSIVSLWSTVLHGAQLLWFGHAIFPDLLSSHIPQASLEVSHHGQMTPSCPLALVKSQEVPPERNVEAIDLPQQRVMLRVMFLWGGRGEGFSSDQELFILIPNINNGPN